MGEPTSGVGGGGSSKPAVAPLFRFPLQKPVTIQTDNVVRGPDNKMMYETMILPAGTKVSGAMRNGIMYVQSYESADGQQHVFSDKMGKKATPQTAAAAEAQKFFDEGMGAALKGDQPGPEGTH
jgi:hypothetical protein